MLQHKQLYDSFSRDLLIQTANRDAIVKTIDIQTEEAKKLESELMLIDKSLIAFQKLMDLKKSETTDKIEKLISFGLQKIFEDPSYQFKIIDSVVKNQVSYEFRVFSDSFFTTKGMNILKARGGGIANIVSFLLRLIILMLLDRKGERFIALDEPFTNLDETRHENLVAVVREIVEKLNFQLLIVTHQKSLESFGDVIYELRASGDGTTAVKIL